MAPQQETKYNTSFIPKKTSSTGSGSGSSLSGGGPNLFVIIGLFLFFASIVGGAGVYGWRYQTEKDIESQLDTLRAARAEFDERTIAEATRLNQRINAVKNLLDNHVAPSVIFSILEEKILETVSFRQLDYKTTDDGRINITGSGQATGFEAIVLQSDELGHSDFRDVLFDNVQPNDTGTGVSFSMNAFIDKSVVLYRNHLERIFETDVQDEEELPVDAEDDGELNNQDN